MPVGATQTAAFDAECEETWRFLPYVSAVCASCWSHRRSTLPKADSRQNGERLFLDVVDVVERPVDTTKSFVVAAFENDARDLDSAAEHQRHVDTFETVVQNDAFDLVANLDVDGGTREAVERRSARGAAAEVQPEKHR